MKRLVSLVPLSIVLATVVVVGVLVAGGPASSAAGPVASDDDPGFVCRKFWAIDRFRLYRPADAQDPIQQVDFERGDLVRVTWFMPGEGPVVRLGHVDTRGSESLRLPQQQVGSRWLPPVVLPFTRMQQDRTWAVLFVQIGSETAMLRQHFVRDRWDGPN